MTKVCQTCGDRGFEEAFVYCDSCKIEVIHRYCVGIVPVPFTGYIIWFCEECDESDSDFDCMEVDKIVKQSSNVEPVEEVCSSPVKETMESLDSGKSSELTGLVRNGASGLEAGDSSSGQDHKSCTSKRSNADSDGNDLDQTVEKLKRTLKKKKKNTDKEKNSSNHTPPVLAVQDHERKDATNVESLNVSSSQVRETVRRESSERGKPSEPTDLVRNEASASEAEKSTNVPYHSSCSSKRTDSGSDRNEVDQTANLKHILKEGEKKKKKQKKKNKESSDHTKDRVRASVSEAKHGVHGVQGATIVEPEKVPSSSAVKETKESKKQESTASKKSRELTGIVRVRASVSEAKHSSNVPDTTRERNLSSGTIPSTSENRQLADGNSSCKEAESNTPQMSAGFTSRRCRAQPIKTPIWSGHISVKGGSNCSLDGIVAHVSSLACPRVHQAASSLQDRLSAEMFPRVKLWPNNFVKNGGPKDESIALFFIPSSKSNDEKVFNSLVLEMKNNDLALRCVLDNAELLLFTSNMLPTGSWTFNSIGYLWGVFKPRQTSRH